MVRLTRQTFADCIAISLHEYSDIHGLIEEFGGRVKQFTQDVKDTDTWYIFYEMAKLQKDEFKTELHEHWFEKKVAPTKTE